MDLKNIIIFLVVFFIVLWLQYVDDKKNDNVHKRISLYDKVKIPLISSCFVFLIKDLDYNKCINYVSSIIVMKTPTLENIDSIPQINNMPQINNIPQINHHDNLLNDIIMDPPDF